MKKWRDTLYGFVIGATMMVPGVSGGSMAMILGIYDKLISAVSDFRAKSKSNFLFLFIFVICAAAGIFFFSAPLNWLLMEFPVYTRYFFLGAVFGGVPMILKKAGGKIFCGNSFIYILTGVLAVLLLSLIPADLVGMTEDGGLKKQAMLVLVGVPVASAMILPGISVSHFLLILGLYDRLVYSIQNLKFGFLVPLGIGIMLGIIPITKILEYVMEHYPRASYLTILGFVLGSLGELFPGIPGGKEIIGCLVTFFCGFILIYKVSQRESE